MNSEDRWSVRHKFCQAYVELIRRVFGLRRHEFLSYTLVSLIQELCRQLWWMFVPGVLIKARWPRDDVSADPNYHYRPWLEEHVGRQGWDWDFDLLGHDVSTNRVSIKFRWPHKQKAMWAALQWT